MSLSADGGTIATCRVKRFERLVASDNQSGNGVKVSTGTNEGAGGVALMPDGKIIYNLAGSGTADLVMVNADGSGARPLTANSGLNVLPAVSQDGRFIVFVSNRNGGPHVWRMNNDGSNQKQITNGIAEIFPVVSPDNQWILYQNIATYVCGEYTIDGGSGKQLTDKLQVRQ